MTIKDLKGNIQPFEKEFICAGARTSIIGLYRKLIELGANHLTEDESLLNTKKPIVLFCKNNGINCKFAEVRIFNRQWWNYWHNPKNRINKPKYKTYNVPKQWDFIINKLIILKEIPLFHETHTVD